MKILILFYIIYFSCALLHRRSRQNGTVRFTSPPPRLYRMGESLVVSMQVDITRQILQRISHTDSPGSATAWTTSSKLPAIYVNGRKQHIFFQRETGRQEKTMKKVTPSQ